jgi:hypothetical protein
VTWVGEWRKSITFFKGFAGFSRAWRIIIYSLINIHFRQHSYITKAWIKANATCFDLKCHHQAKLRDMKFFTVWLRAFGIPDGLQFCCDSYHAPNLIYIILKCQFHF